MMRLKQIAVALDQLVNAILGGWAGETMSSRAWRLRAGQPYKTIRPVIDRLFFLTGPNHCERSFNNRLGYVPDEPRS